MKRLRTAAASAVLSMAAGAAGIAVRGQAPANVPAPPAAGAKSSTPAASAQGGGAVLRTTSRLVEINVVVQNKKGVPIDGLTKDNFVLTDQGKPQQISVFSIQSLSAISANGAAATASTAPPPGAYANGFTANGNASATATILLFDTLNSTVQDQAVARQEMIKFLGQLRPQDHIAIYLLTTHLEILHEFTYDSRALIRAVSAMGVRNTSPSLADAAANAGEAGVQPGDTTGFDPASTDFEAQAGDDPEMLAQAQEMETFLNTATGQVNDFDITNRVETTAAALEAIAEHVRAVPGRKNLIWLSGSFPISIGFTGNTLTPGDRTQRDFSSEITGAARALNDVNLAVYPVDVRGLTNSSMIRADQPGTFNSRRQATAAITPQTDPRPFDTMTLFADRTGGKAFFNGNDLAKAARLALLDSQLTYEIGFYPDHGKWDGKFHDLKIRLVNVPDANARYRRGYFAVPDPPPSLDRTRAAMISAITSPVEYTGLHMLVRLEPPDPDQAGQLPLSVKLEVQQFALAEDKGNGHRQGAADLLFAQLGADGGVLAADGPQVNLDLDPVAYQTLTTEGLTLLRHEKVAPGAVTLRVIARDPNSGAMGSVTIPLGPGGAAAK